jgi:hypothetical protein
MKKTFIFIGIVLAAIILISIISVALSPEAKQSFEQGMKKGQQTVEGNTK